MRILVTGARGFAGTHLLAELGRTGSHQITAASVDEPDDLPEVAEGESTVRWMPLDVTSVESVRAVVEASRPDRVYHLAGQASVGESLRMPLPTWNVNATGTLVLLDALHAAGLSSTRLLLASSAEVYGAVPSSAQPTPESRPLLPLTPYGASKAAAETVAAQFGRAGMVDVVIARSFNQIGPGQDERFVLPSFALQLARIGRGRGEPVLSVGNLDVRRDFLDIRDAMRGYVAIMERGESGSVYNVCSGVSRSLSDVVQRLVELSRLDVRIEVDADRVRPVDIPELIGSPERLRGLGWPPPRELDLTLADLLAAAGGKAATGG